MNLNSDAPEHRTSMKSWGAEFVGDGEVRFRIWAPQQPALSLQLHGTVIPMTKNADGWFEILVEDVVADSSYAFILADGTIVPDPASRGQVDDLEGLSVIVDPTAYSWTAADWRGRPWQDAIIYELHVGTFTPEGTFTAAAQRLDHLAALGITAIEIMPVAHFPGDRGWGYDGVLPYAPHRAYGTPEEMKTFIDMAHGRGMMVLLDVVYNHFGPRGNYLSVYAPEFFHPERHTPWGPAIAFDREPVREFFIENTLYWLEEFRLDGLRFDAIDQIDDEMSHTHVLKELTSRVKARFPDRHIHLVAEDGRNGTELYERDAEGEALFYKSNWNDDFHHVIHVIATGETDGYYADFTGKRWKKLAQTLAEGFVFQQDSTGRPERSNGERSAHLPPTAFIDFIQNHDQIGNRAFGDRLTSLVASEQIDLLTSVLLLSPHIPMLFMGEEFGETQPFRFFADYDGDIALAMRKGRYGEVSGFGNLPPHVKDYTDLPDPNDPGTFEISKLDWSKAGSAEGQRRMELVRSLLAIRRQHIVPGLALASGNAGCVIEADDGLIAIDWTLGDRLLQLRANFSAETQAFPALHGQVISIYPADIEQHVTASNRLPSGSMIVAMSSTNGGRGDA